MIGLLETLDRDERITLDAVQYILKTAKTVLRAEANVSTVGSPVVVFGDLHGQLSDLKRSLSLVQSDVKNPKASMSGDSINSLTTKSSLLFLGNYVNHGAHSCELMLTVLTLKILKPDRVFLLRGNHECDDMCKLHGFHDECSAKYGAPIFEEFLRVFRALPVAAIIDTGTERPPMLALHGGLSPALETIAQIAALDCDLDPPEKDSPLSDLLWSDPMSDIEDARLASKRRDMSRQLPSPSLDCEFDEPSTHYFEWEANQARSCGVTFGSGALATFLNANGLHCIIRGHQPIEGGYRCHFTSFVGDPDESDLGGPIAPTVITKVAEECVLNMLRTALQRCARPGSIITVFSATNYRAHGNDAAILLVGWKDLPLSTRVVDLDGFVHAVVYKHEPSPPPDSYAQRYDKLFADILTTCPYIPHSAADCVRFALRMGARQSLGSDQGVGSHFHTVAESSRTEELHPRAAAFAVRMKAASAATLSASPRHNDSLRKGLDPKLSQAFSTDELMIIEQLFKLLDLKRDEKIDLEELASCATVEDLDHQLSAETFAKGQAHRLDFPEIRQAMVILDADGDGFIDFKDFVEFAARLKAHRSRIPEKAVFWYEEKATKHEPEDLQQQVGQVREVQMTPIGSRRHDPDEAEAQENGNGHLTPMIDVGTSLTPMPDAGTPVLPPPTRAPYMENEEDLPDSLAKRLASAVSSWPFSAEAAQTVRSSLPPDTAIFGADEYIPKPNNLQLPAGLNPDGLSLGDFEGKRVLVKTSKISESVLLQASVLTELTLLRSLKDPNIVQFAGAFHQTSSAGPYERASTSISVMMELAEAGALREVIDQGY